MMASQMIYTACGKTKNGGFEVWAKSADITFEEWMGIQQMMKYEIPLDIAYRSTEEDIRRCPKKFGYFRLSSGRYCIAQSTYIGKVYCVGDVDNRIGNYIIHAFVAEDFGNLLPMTLIGSKLFKTHLTYEEWHDNEAPEDLAPIDLSEGINALDQNTVQSFFTDERCGELEWLLQAIINASATDETVTFHDADEYLPYWYRAISLCLPRCLQKQLTFCSMHTPIFKPQGTVAGAGMSYADIKLQNVPLSVSTTTFDYEQEFRMGHFVFDFQNGRINKDIAVSKYVRAIVGMMRENLFDTLMTVDAVDKLMQKLACSVDQAAALLNLRNGNYQWFTTLEELIETLNIAQSGFSESIPAVCDGLYEECILGDRFPCCEEMLPLFRLVYERSEKADKGKIVEKYIANRRAFGISDASEYNEFVRELRAKAPFPWAAFEDYLLALPDFSDYFAVSGFSFLSQYTVYSTLVKALGTISEKQRDRVSKYLLAVMANVIEGESMEQFDVLVGCTKPLGEKWEAWLVKNAMVMLTQNARKLTDVCDAQFLFKLISRLSVESLALQILQMLISENGADDQFIRLYIAQTYAEQEVFDRLETKLQTDPAYEGFVEKVVMFRFVNKSNLTRKDLDRYYKQFYKTRKDNGVFIRKMAEFLDQVPAADRIDVCDDLYTAWFLYLPDEHLDVMDCLSVMATKIFELDFEYLLKYTEKKGMGAFAPVMIRLEENGLPLPDHYAVLKLGMDIRAVAKGKRTLQEDGSQKMPRHSLYASLKNAENLRVFAKYFLVDVLYMYLLLSNQKGPGFERVLEKCLTELSTTPRFADALAETVDRLEKRAYARMMADIFAYAYGGEATELSGWLQCFLDRYLEEGGRGKRKKVFATVIEQVRPAYAKPVKQFIEDYQVEHVSFIDKLFGGIGKTVRPPKEEKQWDDETKKHPKK